MPRNFCREFKLGQASWAYHATYGGRNPVAAFLGRLIMTLCPVALAVGCIKCPIFKICPVKGIIGDYKKDAPLPSDLKKKQ